MLPRNSQLRESSNLNDHLKFNIIANEQQINSPPIVILYLHGNTNDRFDIKIYYISKLISFYLFSQQQPKKQRSTGHRLHLYDLLRNLDYHIIAVDYRGYGIVSITIWKTLNCFRAKYLGIFNKITKIFW